MNRFENVDVLAALEQLMRQNTAFTAMILRSTRRSFGRLRPATSAARTKRCCGCPARPGRTVSGNATFSCKIPGSITHGAFTESRPVTVFWLVLARLHHGQAVFPTSRSLVRRI